MVELILGIIFGSVIAALVLLGIIVATIVVISKWVLYGITKLVSSAWHDGKKNTGA